MLKYIGQILRCSSDNTTRCLYKIRMRWRRIFERTIFIISPMSHWLLAGSCLEKLSFTVRKARWCFQFRKVFLYEYWHELFRQSVTILKYAYNVATEYEQHETLYVHLSCAWPTQHVQVDAQVPLAPVHAHQARPRKSPLFCPPLWVRRPVHPPLCNPSIFLPPPPAYLN